MASIIYNSLPEDMANGNVIFGTHTFYAMLTSSSYTENKDTHTKRSDITNEVTGAGYVSGGVPVTITVTKDLATDRTLITLGQAIFEGVTITAKKCIYYRSRGGAASADELVGCNDFTSEATLVNGDLTVNESVVRLQN